MKIKNMLLCLILSVGLNAYANPDDRVRDELITTTDRSCGIHYLTHNNTVGWYLTEVHGACPNGLLDGTARVTIRNAFGKIVQNINGPFAHGYLTTADYGGISLKTLWLSDTTEQNLVFDLGAEERLNIRYLGKMTTTRQADGTYSAFNACAPAVVLAVTPNLDLFEDEAVQLELINSVLNRLAPICPDTRQVYFYGSSNENPENKDVAFFADINLETGHIKIRRLPASPRVRDILANPLEASDVPIPREIRRETGLPVVQITPIKPENKPFIPPKEAPERPTLPATVQPDSNDFISDPEPVTFSYPAPIVQPITEPEKIIRTISVPQQISVSEAANKPTEIIPNPPQPLWDDIPAILTASRLLKQPVEGKALVHIARFDAMGIALTDNPAHLRIKGDKIPLGWVVVEGTFSHTPPQKTTDAIGFVQARSITPMKEK